MVGVVAKLKIKEGNMEEVLRMFLEFIKEVRNEPGTLSYTVNRDEADPNVIVVIEYYKSSDALNAHSSTLHFKKLFKQISEHLSGKPEISILEELISI